MKCASCQHENESPDKFCSECGSPLVAKCASCGTTLKPGAKFCSECGASTVSRAPGSTAEPSPRRVADYTPAHLAERIRAEQAALEARGATDGERKTITALFADLKGSTGLMEGVDPEEVRAIIDPALQLMMDSVHQYDGYVAQALGDGIFALFGAPLAHEDHPQRAIYAALGMQEAMRRYADTLRAKGYPPLQMRVGLNTGEVVVRSIRKDDLHTDYVPVGHSTNLAARMEQLANPGTIVVSAYTHRLTDGYFAFKDLGPTQVKGVEAPLNIYEVLSVGPFRTRLQVAARRGLTQFVGRQSEMAELNRALEHAKAGHGQIVGVMGEPGLGKSRLFYEFKLLSVGGCLVLEAYSVSHGKATAYLPVIELLKSYFEIQSRDDERKRREKVTGKVLNLDRSLENTLPYLFALLDIAVESAPILPIDAQVRRHRTFDALKKLFLRESLNQPLILVFEDLHWIDDETQGFLDVLTATAAGAKLLLLTNYRPEYRNEWVQKTYYTQLRLAPLGQAETEELLTFLLGSDESLAPMKPLILKKTQSTPFFMEEVVQTLAEDGTLIGTPGKYQLSHPVSTLQLPSTVQAILAARIDRLAPEEKALLQQLSVIGREFPLSLIRKVLTQPEADLHRLLASLQYKEFLYEQPAFPEVEYIFKHALTQEVAYGTVLQDQRKLLHEQTARAIESLYAIKPEDQYDALARHYSRSGNAKKAVEYLSLAGQQAARHSANTEAITHFTSAVALLNTLSDSAESTHQELSLQLHLGASLLAVQGWASSATEQAFARAYNLSATVDDADRFMPLWGMAMVAVVRADFARYDDLGRALVTHAEATADPMHRACAHWVIGQRMFHLGDFRVAISEFEQAIVGFENISHIEQVNLLGADFSVFTLSYLSHAWWCVGRVEEAVNTNRKALDLARQIGHAFSIALAHAYAAMLYVLLDDLASAELNARTTIELSREHGFKYYLGWGQFVLGWTCATGNTRRLGEDNMRQGLKSMNEGGARLRGAYYLALVAERCIGPEMMEVGREALNAAVEEMARTGERSWQAELCRIQGVMEEFSEKGTAAAETHYRQAIATARGQEALSWELRAALPLARLLARTHRATEAHTLLVDLYQRFNEGFNHRALKDVHALIETLR